jgi:hypothetical protein
MEFVYSEVHCRFKTYAYKFSYSNCALLDIKDNLIRNSITETCEQKAAQSTFGILNPD